MLNVPADGIRCHIYYILCCWLNHYSYDLSFPKLNKIMKHVLTIYFSPVACGVTEYIFSVSFKIHFVKHAYSWIYKPLELTLLHGHGYFSLYAFFCKNNFLVIWSYGNWCNPRFGHVYLLWHVGVTSYPTGCHCALLLTPHATPNINVPMI